MASEDRGLEREFAAALSKALLAADPGAWVKTTEIHGLTRIDGEFDLLKVARAVLDEANLVERGSFKARMP